MGRDTSQISTHVDINTRFSEIRVELDKGGNPSLGLELQHVTRARDDSCECAKPAVPRIEGRKLELRLDLVFKRETDACGHAYGESLLLLVWAGQVSPPQAVECDRLRNCLGYSPVEETLRVCELHAVHRVSSKLVERSEKSIAGVVRRERHLRLNMIALAKRQTVEDSVDCHVRGFGVEGDPRPAEVERDCELDGGG